MKQLSRFAFALILMLLIALAVGCSVQHNTPSTRFYHNPVSYTHLDVYKRQDPASVGANGIAWWNYPQATKVMGGVSFHF